MDGDLNAHNSMQFKSVELAIDITAAKFQNINMYIVQVFHWICHLLVSLQTDLIFDWFLFLELTFPDD